jgi:hypothetical protein
MATTFPKSEREMQDEDATADALAFLARTGGAGCTVTMRPTVNRMVNGSYLLITDAPPVVSEAVIRHFKYVSVQDGGLLINVHNVREDDETGN